MGIARPPGHLAVFAAAHQVVGPEVGQHGHLGVEQGHVDVLSFAGAFGVAQGRLNGYGGVQPGEQVGHGHADLLGAAAGQVVAFTGDAHQAAHALDGVVVAGALPVRAGLAKTRDGAVDQARVDGAQALEVQPVAGHVPDLVVLDEDMGVLHQLADEGLALGLGDVAGDGALVAVGAQVVGGFGGVGAVPPPQKRRTPAAGVVATGVAVAGRALNLDDVGAEVGQGLCAPGSGEHAGQVEYADTIQSVHAVIVAHAGLEARRAGGSSLPGVRCVSGCVATRFSLGGAGVCCGGGGGLQPDLQLARAQTRRHAAGGLDALQARVGQPGRAPAGRAGGIAHAQL